MMTPGPAAYDVLSDATKRKEYDILLEAGYFKHDPRVYAEIMNERNMKWAKQAGFTFTRRGPVRVLPAAGGATCTGGG